MPADKKSLNPFDVEGLEKSLSDSATRVSTIWISYLLFGLYLLVTAGTATDTQLLLADPIKLPALGTEVPLLAFFVLSPIFFALLHFYVLLQTLLLGRTARAYDYALNRNLTQPAQNALFRERLANTIFAQIFAGAPREREGWIGSVLRGIAWFTLVGSPVLVLLTFQFAFLPYHNHYVTWAHRGLILIEIVIAFTLWPAVINPAKEFGWYRFDLRFWRAFRWPWIVSAAKFEYDLKEAFRDWGTSLYYFESRRLSSGAGEAAKRFTHEINLHNRNVIAKTLAKLHLQLSVTHSRFFGQLAAFAVLALSVISLSAPGEWHINLLSFRSVTSIACDRWMPTFLDLDKKLVLDRLKLKDVKIIEPDVFKKMNEDASPGVKMYDGARSKNLSGRDFVCGQFEGVDFRRTALEDTHFEGSFLINSRFDGARMTNTYLNGAYLNGANFTTVKLDQAHLREAKLYKATLKDVDLSDADLAGVDLSEASLTTVIFSNAAKLSGANLIRLKTNDSSLSLVGAHLEGASMQYADLKTVDLAKAIMDGADLFEATLPSKFQPASAKGSFSQRPPDWDKSAPAQRLLADQVGDTICRPDTDEQRSVLNENRSQIVAAIIQNALYPRKGDASCANDTDADAQPTCPEQPEAYRVELADRLAACPVAVLGKDEDTYLRRGNFKGFAGQKKTAR